MGVQPFISDNSLSHKSANGSGIRYSEKHILRSFKIQKQKQKKKTFLLDCPKSYYICQNTRRNSSACNFSGKKSISAYISMWKLKSGILGRLCFETSLWHDTWDVCTLWYVWNEGTHSYFMVPHKHTLGIYFLKGW